MKAILLSLLPLFIVCVVTGFTVGMFKKSSSRYVDKVIFEHAMLREDDPHKIYFSCIDEQPIYEFDVDTNKLAKRIYPYGENRYGKWTRFLDALPITDDVAVAVASAYFLDLECLSEALYEKIDDDKYWRNIENGVFYIALKSLEACERLLYSYTRDTTLLRLVAAAHGTDVEVVRKSLLHTMDHINAMQLRTDIEDIGSQDFAEAFRLAGMCRKYFVGSGE